MLYLNLIDFFRNILKFKNYYRIHILSVGKFNYFFRLNFFIIKCLCIKYFKNSEKATEIDQYAGIKVGSPSGFYPGGNCECDEKDKRRVEMSAGLQKR